MNQWNDQFPTLSDTDLRPVENANAAGMIIYYNFDQRETRTSSNNRIVDF